MGNILVFGLAGLSGALVLVCIVIFLSGVKKAKGLNDLIQNLTDEKSTLKGDLAVLGEKVERIAPLQEELAGVKQKQETLQDHKVRLSADYAAEVEKNKGLQAKLEEVRQHLDQALAEVKGVDGLKREIEATARKAEESQSDIAQLEVKLGETKQKLQEQSDIVEAIRKVYSSS